MNRPTVCKLSGCDAPTPQRSTGRPAEYCSDAHRRRAAIDRLYKLHEQEAADMTPRQLAEELCKVSNTLSRSGRESAILTEAAIRIVYYRTENTRIGQPRNEPGSEPTA